MGNFNFSDVNKITSPASLNISIFFPLLRCVWCGPTRPDQGGHNLQLFPSRNKSVQWGQWQCLSDLSRLICPHQLVSSVRFVTKSVSLPVLSCQPGRKRPEKKGRKVKTRKAESSVSEKTFETFQHPQPVRLTLDCKLRHPSPPYTKSSGFDKDFLKKLNIQRLFIT